jgi:hypothetical protein
MDLETRAREYGRALQETSSIHLEGKKGVSVVTFGNNHIMEDVERVCVAHNFGGDIYYSPSALGVVALCLKNDVNGLVYHATSGKKLREQYQEVLTEHLLTIPTIVRAELLDGYSMLTYDPVIVEEVKIGFEKELLRVLKGKAL